MKKLRAIAFVLPQFHPIPENDKWWGKGFTEWTNVRKAKPLFKKHYQPHVPTKLGYYDLRSNEDRNAQANLAKQYGIKGFCYYHYWFNGKRLLNQPIDDILELNEPDMPFMLCWANENWTRAWDGKDKDILIEQEYSTEDDRTHISWLCKEVFSDVRYIKVNGSPVFMVYRPDLFPDIKKTCSLWRKIAIEEFGFPDLYLCFTESFNKRIDPESIGFNAAVEFAPHQVIRNRVSRKNIWQKFIKFGFTNIKDIDVRDFKLGVKQAKRRKLPNYKLYRCVTPSWDNTPRKNEKGIVAIGSSPKLYFKWLRHVIKTFKPYSKEENFIFINAWNEWAEGNHLEPCEKYGLAFLKATKKALKNN